jgi:EAL domain-containing protein (putative c-di-GMP-specific phosphodiesterase class I)
MDPLPGLVKAAERSPVIFPLERWAITRCGEDVGRWPATLRDLRINVNVSAREFDHGGLASGLGRLVRRSGLEPARVSLEITETSALRDPEAVAGLLDGLKGQGFEVWLDDFGTGHSSLAWLRLLPIDGLKIPAEFVLDVHARPRVATITSAVIRLAHDLGLRVVGEGVETQADLEWLNARACDQVQGFLLYPPMAAEDLAARLA